MPTVTILGTPIVEAVTNDIVLALRDVTRANGYSTTLRFVTRFQKNPFSAARLPGACVYALRDRHVEPTAYRVETRRLFLMVEAWITGTSPDRLDQELILLQQDIYLAVMDDPQRHQLALNTDPGDVRRLLAEESDLVAGIEMDFAVNYRHDVARPWVQL